MNTVWAEVLSRLTDGEPVDPEVVAEALESPETRRLFVDYVRLSATVRADHSEPSLAFFKQMVRTLQPSHRRSSDHLVSFRIVAALALAILLTGLGVEISRHWREDSPPRPSRVLRFDPSEWTSASRDGS